MAQQKTNRGFTIVELLIVIVVIAILATITIIGFNGVQERARNTTNAESASQLRTKIEAWNSIKGAYPTTAQLTANLIIAGANADEAKIDGALASNFTVQSAVASSAASAAKPGAADTIKPVFAYACGSTTAPTGYVLTWRTTETNSRTILGTCPA